MDHLCYLCLVFVMISRLFIAALWSPAGKGLTSWLLFVMFNCILLSMLNPFLITFDFIFEKVTEIRFSNNSFEFLN